MTPEGLIKFMDEIESWRGFLLRIQPQPDQYMSCASIDSVHELNLLASLQQIVLIYTTLVCPDTTWLVQVAQMTQSIEN